VGVAMGVALLPLLSKQLRQGNVSEAITTQNRATELVLFLTLPATIVFIMYSDLFVTLLYGYGKFIEHPGNVIQTSRTLAAFSLGLPAYVLVKVFSSTFFARTDTVTPVVIGIISIIINIIVNLFLMGPYQHVGIAIGTAISSWINAFLLVIILKMRKLMVFDRHFFFVLPKILISSTIMGVVIYCIQPYFAVYVIDGSVLGKIGVLSTLILAGSISFLVPAYFLKCIDLKNIRK
jgi:putative peptidoglycan lipid II flippase